MNLTDIPTKFPIPFALNAGPSYIRTIPQNSQIGIQAGAASLNDGFPPATMTPVGGGGTPPFGQDMNGILKLITQWSQWTQAGGSVPYDSTFQTGIGGYPKGAQVKSAINDNWYYSLVDGNTSNPDLGGANWVAYSPIDLFGVDSGSANAGAITLSPAPPSMAYLKGRTIKVQKVSSANTGAYTLNINGLGSLAVTHQNGTALVAGEVPASAVFIVIYDGTKFQLQGTTISTTTSGSLFVPGYFTLFTPAGTVYVQWAIGPTDAGNTTNEVKHTIAWPVPFPNACLVAFVSIDKTDLTNSNASDATYQTVGWTVNNVTVQLLIVPDDGNTGDIDTPVRSVVFGIGF